MTGGDTAHSTAFACFDPTERRIFRRRPSVEPVLTESIAAAIEQGEGAWT